MLHHMLNIGMLDKTTLKQELTEKQFIDLIVDTIGDCIISKGHIGIYTHHDGKRVIEPSLIVNQFGMKKKNMVTCVKKLCKLLNQETIILTTKQSNSEFISEV